MPFRPFEDIGFACNPFRALTREEWARVAVIPEAVRRAVGEGGHLQILGESGFGKTTSLLALAQDFREAGLSCVYEYLPQGKSRFRTKTGALDVFLLDEAQRLSRGFLFLGKERKRLLLAAKAGTRLILGSHDDLSDMFVPSGVPLHTALLAPPNSMGLAEILEHRLGLFALRDDRARFSEESADWLTGEFRGDLRTMEYFLYDFFQSERPAGTIHSGSLRQALRRFTPPEAGPGSGVRIWG